MLSKSKLYNHIIEHSEVDFVYMWAVTLSLEIVGHGHDTFWSKYHPNSRQNKEIITDQPGHNLNRHRVILITPTTTKNVCIQGYSVNVQYTI